MAIYCHFVRRWQGVGAQPWQGDQRGWNPFARTPIRDKGRSILYIHRVALLPLNLRTVYEQSEETSKCAYLCFYLVGRSNSRDKKLFKQGYVSGLKVGKNVQSRHLMSHINTSQKRNMYTRKVTVEYSRSDDMTPPRSFAHCVRSWVCGGRCGSLVGMFLIRRGLNVQKPRDIITGLRYSNSCRYLLGIDFAIKS